MTTQTIERPDIDERADDGTDDDLDMGDESEASISTVIAALDDSLAKL